MELLSESIVVCVQRDCPFCLALCTFISRHKPIIKCNFLKCLYIPPLTIATKTSVSIGRCHLYYLYSSNDNHQNVIASQFLFQWQWSPRETVKLGFLNRNTDRNKNLTEAWSLSHYIQKCRKSCNLSNIHLSLLLLFALIVASLKVDGLFLPPSFFLPCGQRYFSLSCTPGKPLNTRMKYI